MKNAHGDEITENMIVRLRADVYPKRKRMESAQVVGWVEGIEGGVQLDRVLEGFRYWNIDDLEPTVRRNA